MNLNSSIPGLDFGNSTWATGDWDGNADFTTNDFVIALQQGGYERGPRDGVSVVPEPSGLLLVLLGGLWIGTQLRRRSAV